MSPGPVARRWMAGAALVAALVTTPAHAGPVRPLLFAGIGFPELLHAEVGVLIHGRASIEVSVGWPLLNLEAGVQVTGWFLGEAGERPPRHALLGALALRLNPTLSPFRLRSGGDALGGTVNTMVGYAFTTDAGFSVRLLAGVLWAYEQSVTAGPGATLGVGWVF